MQTQSSFPKLVITNVAYSAWESSPVKFLVSNSVYGFGEGRVETVEEALELLFRQLNHVDGSELISVDPQYKGLRSMSVGDYVTFRGIGGWKATFRCEGAGWSQVA